MNCVDYFVDRYIREGRSNKVAFRKVHGDSRDITYGQLASDSVLSGAAFSNASISPHQQGDSGRSWGYRCKPEYL